VHHAIIIGAGFGGLAAAVRLSARGYRVTVVDRLDEPGGRARVHRQDGFVFDAGPTVITAPFLFEELWTLCRRRLADDVDLRPIEPFYRIRFHDGDTFDYTGSADAMRAEVARLAPGDVAGYDAFLRHSERIYRVGFEELAHVPFDSPLDMARVVPAMVRLESYRTVAGLVARYVQDERLRQVLGFHPLLIGGNPYSATSIYALIAYLERAWGVYFPMGGTGALVRGLVRLLESRGGALRLGEEVDRILTEAGRATGVRLRSGEEVRGDIVVSNADSVWTYRHLLPASERRKWTNRRLDALRSSMSLFVWYFGTDRRYEDVAHHSILLGPRYRGLLTDIFERKVLADDFSLYLHRPTATDPSLAPPGCDAFYVLSPVPHLGAGFDWSERAEPYRRAVEARLRDTVLPDLPAHVVTSRVLTPQGFEDDYLAFRGAAFGIEPLLTQSAWFRPHNRSEDVERLYLVGAGTHPGAGVPGVLSSARVLDRVVPDPAALDTPESDLAACRALLQRGSRSFFAAFRFLPAAVQGPVSSLYAFCRQADDAIDEAGDLARVRARLDRAFAGDPEPTPVDRAFARLICDHRLPRAIFDAMMEGFAWDLEGRRYESPSDLRAYCARVAATVGVLMTLLLGERSEAALGRACDLGVAMQLTNIARDVGDDARRGRLYLPLAWLRDAGLCPDRLLAKPRFSPALGRVVRRLLAEADWLYDRADAGIPLLPRGSRPAIRAAPRLRGHRPDAAARTVRQRGEARGHRRDPQGMAPRAGRPGAGRRRPSESARTSARRGPVPGRSRNRWPLSGSASLRSARAGPRARLAARAPSSWAAGSRGSPPRRCWPSAASG
jgi:phytoene desaturase